MYAVVGCRNCSALWLIEGRTETISCPRCNHRRAYEKFRTFVETDDENHAREVRASMLANRQDEGETFAGMDSFAEMDEYLDEAGVSDEEYLEASGIDPEEVAAAGERATSGGTSRSRPEIVRDAIRAGTEDDRPDEDAIVEYAAERGVPADWTRRQLRKLVTSGAVVDDDGYRLL